MSKKQKRWSKQEKLAILQEATQSGVLVTCRTHEVSTATFYNWKKVYDTYGETGFRQNGSADRDYRKLEEENRRLKKLLVEKELALEVQQERLKKKFGTADLRKLW